MGLKLNDVECFAVSKSTYYDYRKEYQKLSDNFSKEVDLKEYFGGCHALSLLDGSLVSKVESEIDFAKLYYDRLNTQAKLIDTINRLAGQETITQELSRAIEVLSKALKVVDVDVGQLVRLVNDNKPARDDYDT